MTGHISGNYNCHCTLSINVIMLSVGPSKLQADATGDPNLGIKRIHHELGYSNNIGLDGKADNNR